MWAAPAHLHASAMQTDCASCCARVLCSYVRMFMAYTVPDHLYVAYIDSARLHVYAYVCVCVTAHLRMCVCDHVCVLCIHCAFSHVYNLAGMCRANSVLHMHWPRCSKSAPLVLMLRFTWHRQGHWSDC
jgi:hypothetical protein